MVTLTVESHVQLAEGLFQLITAPASLPAKLLPPQLRPGLRRALHSLFIFGIFWGRQEGGELE